MPSEDRIRLLHAIEAAETACGFVAGKTRSDLDTDQMMLFAVVRAIEIVGEAASRISLATRQATEGVPWPLIVAMRNRLVHAYFDIDRDVVWKTVTEELPNLLPKLRQLVDRIGE